MERIKLDHNFCDLHRMAQDSSFFILVINQLNAQNLVL